MNFYYRLLLTTAIAAVFLPAYGQPDNSNNKLVIVTGARFSYELIEKWIEEYSRVKPDVQIIIESRGSADPLRFDILAEVYEHPREVRVLRNYLYIGRYAVLPVANSSSSFAKEYAQKGVNQSVLKTIFFHDIFAGENKRQTIEYPFTTYARMQKAGAPSVFAEYFGYDQKDIKGTRIAGADSHLLKVLLRDTSAVSHLPLPLIYDLHARQPIDGLAVLPPDLNGNNKVSADEKFYGNLDVVIERLENANPKDIKNIPIAYLHLSVSRDQASAEAVDFLIWIRENGQAYLHSYGFLQPEADRIGDVLTSRRR